MQLGFHLGTRSTILPPWSFLPSLLFFLFFPQQKASAIACQFIILQVGLSIFEWSLVTQSYLSKTYNFWLFPRSNGGKEDLWFMSQASSLQFLANCVRREPVNFWSTCSHLDHCSSQGFDFNRCIYQGIPYTTSSGTSRDIKHSPECDSTSRKGSGREGAERGNTRLFHKLTPPTFFPLPYHHSIIMFPCLSPLGLIRCESYWHTQW